MSAVLFTATTVTTPSSPDVRFDQLGLIDALTAAVRKEGYERPTPIQARAIPHVLAGKDLLGLAQTGTGQTAAFALPILPRLQPASRRRCIPCRRR